MSKLPSSFVGGKTSSKLKRRLKSIRALLENAFSPETAVRATVGLTLSAGQCAAVAKIVRDRLGGEYVSARVSGESHWFNRVSVDGIVVDIDLTGDQYGRPPVQFAPAGKLYEGTRERRPEELNEETRGRASLLAARISATRGKKPSSRRPSGELVEAD